MPNVLFLFFNMLRSIQLSCGEGTRILARCYLTLQKKKKKIPMEYHYHDVTPSNCHKTGSAHYKEIRRPTNDYLTGSYLSGPTTQPLAKQSR